jgi:hypothetical protein
MYKNKCREIISCFFHPKCGLLYNKKQLLFLYNKEILLITFPVIVGALYSCDFQFLWIFVHLDSI